jgi:hypothetical protein
MTPEEVAGIRRQTNDLGNQISRLTNKIDATPFTQIIPSPRKGFFHALRGNELSLYKLAKDGRSLTFVAVEKNINGSAIIAPPYGGFVHIYQGASFRVYTVERDGRLVEVVRK